MSLPGGLVSLHSSWFRLPFAYRPRAERRISPDLVALHWHGTNPRENHVANISKTGAYLRTDETWNPGELLSLTLQRRGTFEKSKNNRFAVRAKAVRRDKNGVGISFLFSRGEDLHLWENVVDSEPSRVEPEELIREFRIAAAIAFLGRISPGALERVQWLFRKGLSSHRLEGAVEIALHADDLLSLLNGNTQIQVRPDVVLRILEEGSWTEVEWIRHYWSGLLVTSCEDRKSEDLDFNSPALLSQLTTIQTRIFSSACDSARKFVGPEGHLVARRQMRSAEELMRISGIHDPVHIERDLHHLTQLGLLEPQTKWAFFSRLERAEVTPTNRALRLYARCHAHRGELSGFYGLEDSNSCAYATT